MEINYDWSFDMPSDKLFVHMNLGEDGTAQAHNGKVFDATLSLERKELTPAQLRDTLVDVLRLPARSAEPPEFRILRSTRPRGYPLPQATSYAVETEPRERAPTIVSFAHLAFPARSPAARGSGR